MSDARELTHKLKQLRKKRYRKDLEGGISEEMRPIFDKKEKQIEEAIRDQSSKIDQPKRIKGVTEHIDTKTRLPLKTGEQFSESVAKKRILNKLSKGAGKFAKAGLKSLPLIGGLATAIQSRDVSAAIPLLDQADDLGPAKGSPGAIIEDPKSSPEDRKKAIKLLRKQGGR
jgi:hypothetical protein